MGASLSETATFPDGFSLDIRCCGTEDDSFAEAILYDCEGKEVALTEPWKMKPLALLIVPMS